MTEVANPNPLSYATPSIRPESRTAPAVWIAVIGLALIVFGGCFLIGVMLTLNSGIPTSMPRIIWLLIVLYAAAFGCFGGAVWLLIKGVRSLFLMLN